MSENILDYRVNASNVVVIGRTGKILLVKQRFFGGKWGLPGGAIEYRETPTMAGVREVKEETHKELCLNSLKLIAILIQRTAKRVLDAIPDFPKEGLVLLYESITDIDEDTAKFLPTEEVLEARFFDFDEIIREKSSVSLGYLRMLIHYHRHKSGQTCSIHEDLLSTPVEVEFFQLK